MADIDTEEPLSNLSDTSFVILGQGSLSSVLNDDSNKEPIVNSVTNSKSSFSGLDSTSGSMFSEEGIQKKLNELVKENYQLKETLSQNNLAIKSQLDTFFMWQQEVLKTHETHKQKFLETKDLILKLRAENTNLKKQLDDSLVCAPTGNDAEIYAEVNKKSEEADQIKEYESMCNNLTRVNENLSMKNVQLSEELKDAKEEILKLRNEMNHTGSNNKSQGNDEFRKTSLESMSYRSLPNSEARAQISNLLKQLDEEKSKVSKLKEELKKVQSSNRKISGTEFSTTDQLNKYIDNLNDMDASLDMQNQRFSSLQSWVSLAEESVRENKINAGVECNIISEINDLKSHLNQEETVSREKQETLQDLKKKFTMLLDEYKTLQKKLSTVNSKETIVEEYKEKITELSAKLKDRETELKSKEEECSNLRQEMEKLNVMQEELDLLKIQAQLYKADFEVERSEREKVVSEREDMAEQVRHLRRKLDSLERDSPKKEEGARTSPLESPGRGMQYICPKCNFAFRSEKDCLEHFDDCVNIHFYP